MKAGDRVKTPDGIGTLVNIEAYDTRKTVYVKDEKEVKTKGALAGMRYGVRHDKYPDWASDYIKVYQDAVFYYYPKEVQKL